MRVKMVDDDERAYVRAYIAKVERKVQHDVLQTLVTERTMGKISAWDYVNDERASGIVALYSRDSREGMRVIARQQHATLAQHDASACEDEECIVCDALYLTPQEKAG